MVRIGLITPGVKALDIGYATHPAVNVTRAATPGLNFPTDTRSNLLIYLVSAEGLEPSTP
jgi:hypothetical protein